MCRVCGDYYSSYQHYRYCNEDAICCDCGAVDTDGTMVVYHSTRDNLYVPNADDKTHSTICSSCGIKINTANEHTRDCSATACTECGYDGPIDWVIHDYNYNQYVDFGDGTHGYVCSYCGDHAMYGLSKHHRSCISDEPVCTNCGSTDTRYITVHNLITVDNGDFTHSYLCSDCRYVIYTSIHYTSCNKYYCGACDARCDMDAPIIRYHSNSYAVPYDSDMHGMYCEDCGQIVAYYEHWYHCSDEIPTCAECDTVVDPEKAYRSHNVDIVDFGNGMHGYSCDDCGEITSAQYHYRYCYSILNECQDCNYRGDDLQVHHDAYLKSNGDGTHSYVCLDCGAIESTEPCYTLCSDQATGRCSACAAAGSFPVTHNFNEQGYTRCENCKYTLTASYLPANLTSIKPDAFNNTALQYVVIPNGCTEIGARAFANCENLVVKIPASVNSIAASAFSGCSNLRILCSVGSEALNYALAHNISYTIRN